MLIRGNIYIYYFEIQDPAENKSWAFSSLYYWKNVLEADKNRLLRQVLSGELSINNFGLECFKCLKMKHANLFIWDTLVKSGYWEHLPQKKKKNIKTCAQLIVSFFVR